MLKRFTIQDFYHHNVVNLVDADGALVNMPSFVTPEYLDSLNIGYQSEPFYPLTEREVELCNFGETLEFNEESKSMSRSTRIVIFKGEKYLNLYDFDIDNPYTKSVADNYKNTTAFYQKIAETLDGYYFDESEGKEEASLDIVLKNGEYDVDTYLPLSMFDGIDSFQQLQAVFTECKFDSKEEFLACVAKHATK